MDAKATAEKRCTRCKQTKPIDAFCKNKYTRDGLNGMCRVCRSAAGRKLRSSEEGRKYSGHLPDGLWVRISNPDKKAEIRRWWQNRLVRGLEVAECGGDPESAVGYCLLARDLYILSQADRSKWPIVLPKQGAAPKTGDVLDMRQVSG